MGNQGTLRVLWSRAELTTVRDAMELTPNFEGRIEVRDILRDAIRPGHGRYVEFDFESAQRFAARLVAVDMETAIAKAKLLRALRDSDVAPHTAQGGDEHTAEAA